MSFIIDGTPRSIVRVKVNTDYNKIDSLEYYTSKKDIKITTVHSLDKPNVIVDGFFNGESKSVPLGPQAEHRLYFYNDIVKYIGAAQKPLKVRRNTTDEPIVVMLPFGKNDLSIPVPPKCDAVYYHSYLAIYRQEDKSEVNKYFTTDDGLYVVAEDGCTFTYINSKNGASAGGFGVEKMLYHELMPVLNHVIPFGRAPKYLFLLNEDTIITSRSEFKYDDKYNLMTDIKTDNKKLFCKYKVFKNEPKYEYAESVHTLIYDNFDLQTHYNGKLVTQDIIRVDKDNSTMEYIGINYETGKVASVDDKEVNFSDIVLKYFLY